MLNQIQNSNEMPKQVRHDKIVILNLFQNLAFNHSALVWLPNILLKFRSLLLTFH